MNGRVLVLNQDYQAISVCSVQRAFVLVYLDKAEMISIEEQKFLHTVVSKFPYPSIIRLSRFVRVPYKRVVLSRTNIMKRDNHHCQYCGTKFDLTIDHVIPKSKGGTDNWENLVTACKRCNNKKGDHTPHESGMYTMRHPFRPSHIMFLRDFLGKIQETWKPYLYMN